MLDRRPRGSTAVRANLTRGVGAVQGYLGGALAEVREDLSYHPRIPRRRRAVARVQRRTVAVIATGLVAVLAVDLMVFGELSKREAQSAAAARGRDTAERGAGYVAATRDLAVTRGLKVTRAPAAAGAPVTAPPVASEGSSTAPDAKGGPATAGPAATGGTSTTGGTATAGGSSAHQRPPAGDPPQSTTRSQVAPLAELRKPHLFVVTPRPLTAAAVHRVRASSGVKSAEVVDAADVMMGGKRVQTMGVNPSTFRAYTPRATARSDVLWNSVAAGDVAVSFVLGNDGGVPLGSMVSGGGRDLRVGAYATMGMGMINAVVSRDVARSLGIPRNNALVVSAPGADSTRLRLRLLKVLPKGSQVALINPVLTPPSQTRTNWPASSFMSTEQLRVALTAAVSKLGRPYVWGAEGPDTFDCSGLVQWAFGQAGVRMPRVTHQQWVTGPQIPLSQAQPGDLLFWRSDPTNPGYISHVAIYWGDGKMLQAPRTGDVVKISPVSTRNLAGVVRVSPNVAARVR
ncbi:C40 family peptidase [Sphaerisporangium dianthi]|uniref:C40 family peptidase n=1 Tax=Sphaerisporangium dianthi TaxID=1436120 RepID=A0ABV9CP67_9ACTN